MQFKDLFRSVFRAVAPETKAVEDRDFGAMTRERLPMLSTSPAKHPDYADVLRGTHLFSPLGVRVPMYVVVEINSDISDIQRSALHELERKWDSLRDELVTLFRQKLDEWFHCKHHCRATNVSFFGECVSLDGITLPESRLGHSRIELHFDVRPMVLPEHVVMEHSLVVSFENNVVVSVGWEG